MEALSIAANSTKIESDETTNITTLTVKNDVDKVTLSGGKITRLEVEEAAEPSDKGPEIVIANQTEITEVSENATVTIDANVNSGEIESPEVKETDKGIEITIPVFKGTRCIDIERSSDGENFTEIAQKYYWSESLIPTANTSIVYIDSYDYTAGTELTYRIKYDWSKYFDDGNGFSVTPTKNGKPVPEITYLPLPNAQDAAKGILTFPEAASIDFHGEEPDSNTIIQIEFEYKDDDIQYIWVVWNYNDTDFSKNLYTKERDGKTFSLTSASLNYYSNGIITYWNYQKDSDLLKDMPDLVFQKLLADPSIKEQAAATLDGTVLKFSSKGSVNLENTSFENEDDKFFHYYYRESETNDILAIVLDEYYNDINLYRYDSDFENETLLSWRDDDIDSINIYNEETDGHTYTLESAKMTLGYMNIPKFSLEFTPTAGLMPAEIVIPTKAPKLTAKMDGNKVLLTVSNFDTSERFLKKII